MRRRTLSMRVSAIIMAAVVGMSSMTMHVQAAGTQERVVVIQHPRCSRSF